MTEVKNLTLDDFMGGKTDAASIREHYLKDVSKRKKKTRITLITPNVVGSESQARRVQPPLGIACLAGVLEEYNFKDIQVIDSSAEGYHEIRKLNDGFIEFGLEDEKVLEKISKFKPHIVGG